MSKLPRNVKGKQIVSILEKLGFEVVGKKGSHFRLSHPDGRPQGTLRAILRQIDLETEEFIKLL